MRYVIAILAAALAVYFDRLAEHRWYPVAPDMARWLDFSVALFVFFAVVKIFSPRRSSLD